MDIDGTDKKESNAADKYFNFDALEKLGYTKRLSDERTRRYKVASGASKLIMDTFEEDTNIICAGSRGEGMCVSFDSDFDVLFIHGSVKCFENVQLPLNYKNEMKMTTVKFQLDFSDIPPGYTKLRLISFESVRNLKRRNFDFLTSLKEALVQRNEHHYLRNDQILVSSVLKHNRHGHVRQPSVFDEINGPARTYSCEVPGMSQMITTVDCVLALPCEYPSVTDDWCKRERKYTWPNKDLIEKVMELDVYVVPAGAKGSIDEELQWRVSLTTAEQALVHSFNDIQIKLYGAMKMLVKSELKPICENITSYIAKNVIFWTFENNETENMTKDTFDCTLLKVLKFLKFSVSWKYLPNYMVPHVNLLQNKLNEKERVSLIQRIDLRITGQCQSLLMNVPIIKVISCLSSQECEEKIAFSELVDQIVGAVVYIPAYSQNLIPKLVDFDLNSIDVAKIILDEVLPLVRKYKPVGLFDRLTSISNEEIMCRLMNGISRGYHKTLKD